MSGNRSWRVHRIAWKSAFELFIVHISTQSAYMTCSVECYLMQLHEVHRVEQLRAAADLRTSASSSTEE